ncbi:MAG: class I SAM-dependent methyltransferase [Candidatus Hydrogenedentes bacterium]|nr:class I SAM-dependent methyltransferase [Candidatus Hydrogenedentota bacterium]
MNPSLLDQLSRLTPIAEIPITWDATGYTSEDFDAEARSETFEGWRGDLADDEEAELIAHLLDIREGDTLLDVACGYGRHAAPLARDHGARVTGVDIAPGLIEQAKRIAAREGLNIDYRVLHARDLDYSAAFDHALIGFNTLSVFSPDDAPRVLRGIHRALRPDGKLFIDVDNKPFNCRYGTCYRNWHMQGQALVLQEVYFHHESSIEVNRDICLMENKPAVIEFLCFKRIYSVDEVSALLTDCGFAIEGVHGSWDLTELNDASPKIIVVASKRATG